MDSNLEKRGVIFNIQKYSIHDGPGVRTIVFFKGCPLRCRWCSNPEGISSKYQVMTLEDRCISCGKCVEACPQGVHSLQLLSDGSVEHRVNREAICIGCGQCEANCPQEAVRIAGREATVKEVMDVIMQDSAFYWSSGGGVTLGGGEVTRQPDFAAAILEECKKQGIHTAIETCGYAEWDVMKELAKHVDLFLYDLKHIDSEEHKRLTGVNNERILKNMIGLFQIGANVTVRMPLITNMNDSREALEKAMKFIEIVSKDGNLQGIEVLPYHKLGVSKYKQLGLKYSIDEDFGYTRKQLEEIEEFLKKFNLPIRVVKH
ncbi:choline TMA-lyase-activating enzyme [Tissierella sp. MSJ-40]|uniref:Choline trimethylamine-lyase activating enzyme n=1 Tax=Tissierella simiarum TaxID=2841534 RepID=A0ABS6E7I0_9FIRM|nr:choline TMA-lyase-activating enzyme [Tissierella simiarum]MBU5438871.1 choline TMA-lyase-activating enzyme [Tissierella simiarum]